MMVTGFEIPEKCGITMAYSSENNLNWNLGWYILFIQKKILWYFRLLLLEWKAWVLKISLTHRVSYLKIPIIYDYIKLHQFKIDTTTRK